jgi:putative holliday junction resolvase
MGRILGLDIGAKRVGVALSDRLHLVARPLTTLAFTSAAALVRDIGQIVKREEVELVLIGLPWETDGRESEPARLAVLVRDLLEKESIPTLFGDESYSSREAEAIMHERGRRRQSYRLELDQYAAAVILQRYLDSRPAVNR